MRSSERIKQWLRDHPLISPASIESALGLAYGTIRLNSDRAIPGKHVYRIMDLLGEYGMEHSIPKEMRARQLDKNARSNSKEEMLDILREEGIDGN